MHRRTLLSVVFGLFLTLIGKLIADELPAASTRAIDFATDIQPLLKQHCWSCHGIDKQESGLRLDSRDRMLLGGDLGKVVEPGKSESSRLVKLVASANVEQMMPPEGDRLSLEQVGILRAWIDQGCQWPESSVDDAAKNKHWAYLPLNVIEPPTVENESWVRNSIDRFVLAKLEQQQLLPSPEVNRHTLIRRLSLDLVGLLPSGTEVDSFVNDASPNACETLVDRLLASPHFGERWGRHWLDMARYADSDGYEKDNPRPDAYRWRDWVLDAINADMPFDQFTIEQLAGDLLPDATPMQRLATAFHRQTLTNTEGGTDQEQFRVEACFDRTETTGTVWLGLTVGCARCHTHKYDAITQREYYQLFSVFNNGDEATVTVQKSEAEVAEYSASKSVYDAKLKVINDKLHATQSDNTEAFEKWQSARKISLAEAASTPVKLHALQAPNYSSDSGILFESQTGGVVLVSGANPDRAIYSVVGETAVRGITGLRIDVFPDDSLPSKGPGRVAHGNFVLSEVTLEVATNPEFTDARKLKFIKAKADFEQGDRPWLATNTIDGNDETGWAIAPQFGKKHSLILGLMEPFDAPAKYFVRIRMSHQYGQQHTIGRFKVSLQTGTEPDVVIPENLLAALNTPTNERSEEQKNKLWDFFSRQHPVTSELLSQLDVLKKTEPAKPEINSRVVVQRSTDPRKTFILKRGEFLAPVMDQEVQPASFSTLPPMPARLEGVSADRLDLARWLVSEKNPLTPRVTANHVWRLLFGHGIVRTSNDFGVRGERPTHPELLDWLAADLLKGSDFGRPWSRKALIRRIVLSATYRQSSHYRHELREVDPQNLLIARQNRLRVEGEIVRDISLDASGLLSPKIGGPSVFPPLPPGIAELSYAGNFNWTESKGDDRYRRGMYTFFKRTSPHPSLMTFDCPDANIACIERQTSNTPLQALTSLNNEAFAETSRAFARRLLQISSMDDAQRIAEGVRICLSRPASDSEVRELLNLLNDSRNWYGSRQDLAAQFNGGNTPTDVTPEEQAAWIAVGRVLLNLDEFITRE